jgi:hypothetical protein
MSSCPRPTWLPGSVTRPRWAISTSSHWLLAALRDQLTGWGLWGSCAVRPWGKRA